MPTLYILVNESDSTQTLENLATVNRNAKFLKIPSSSAQAAIDELVNIDSKSWTASDTVEGQIGNVSEIRLPEHVIVT